MSDDPHRMVPFVVVWVMDPDPEVDAPRHVFACIRDDMTDSDTDLDTLFRQLVGELVDSDELIRGCAVIVRIYRVEFIKAIYLTLRFANDPEAQAAVADKLHWPPVRCNCLLCKGQDAAVVHSKYQGGVVAEA